MRGRGHCLCVGVRRSLLLVRGCRFRVRGLVGRCSRCVCGKGSCVARGVSGVPSDWTVPRLTPMGRTAVRPHIPPRSPCGRWGHSLGSLCAEQTHFFHPHPQPFSHAVGGGSRAPNPLKQRFSIRRMLRFRTPKHVPRAWRDTCRSSPSPVQGNSRVYPYPHPPLGVDATEKNIVDDDETAKVSTSTHP